MQTVILGRNKGQRVESGHPWVYANEIETISGHTTPGEIVRIENFKKHFIGFAYINTLSQITCRILSRDVNEIIDKDFFRERLLNCRIHREQLGFTENYRLVFGEGDFLPALVVDKFRNYYVLQTLSAGMDKWKHVIAEILLEDFHAQGVYERNDVPVRKMEGLEEVTGFLSEPFPTIFTINEAGVQFQIDIAKGQKTGFFLDQKENRMAIEKICRGAEVLDCFTYTGSFGLYAAKGGAKHVQSLDISEVALKHAAYNAQLNGFTTIIYTEANVFEILPEWSKENKLFDVVILDPPAFTKNRQGIHNASKGYKEINLRGMKLLKPGGFLISFSCSHFISTSLFSDILAEAAHDAGKTIREIQYLTQSKDHPVVWGINETHYLKGFILQIT